MRNLRRRELMRERRELLAAAAAAKIAGSPSASCSTSAAVISADKTHQSSTALTEAGAATQMSICAASADASKAALSPPPRLNSLTFAVAAALDEWCVTVADRKHVCGPDGIDSYPVLQTEETFAATVAADAVALAQRFMLASTVPRCAARDGLDSASNVKTLSTGVSQNPTCSKKPCAPTSVSTATAGIGMETASLEIYATAIWPLLTLAASELQASTEKRLYLNGEVVLSRLEEDTEFADEYVRAVATGASAADLSELEVAVKQGVVLSEELYRLKLVYEKESLIGRLRHQALVSSAAGRARSALAAAEASTSVAGGATQALTEIPPVKLEGLLVSAADATPPKTRSENEESFLRCARELAVRLLRLIHETAESESSPTVLTDMPTKTSSQVVSVASTFAAAGPATLRFGTAVALARAAAAATLGEERPRQRRLELQRAALRAELEKHSVIANDVATATSVAERQLRSGRTKTGDVSELRELLSRVTDPSIRALALEEMRSEMQQAAREAIARVEAETRIVEADLDNCRSMVAAWDAVAAALGPVTFDTTNPSVAVAKATPTLSLPLSSAADAALADEQAKKEALEDAQGEKRDEEQRGEVVSAEDGIKEQKEKQRGRVATETEMMQEREMLTKMREKNKHDMEDVDDTEDCQEESNDHADNMEVARKRGKENGSKKEPQLEKETETTNKTETTKLDEKVKEVNIAEVGKVEVTKEKRTGNQNESRREAGVRKEGETRREARVKTLGPNIDDVEITEVNEKAEEQIVRIAGRKRERREIELKLEAMKRTLGTSDTQAEWASLEIEVDDVEITGEKEGKAINGGADCGKEGMAKEKWKGTLARRRISQESKEGERMGEETAPSKDDIVDEVEVVEKPDSDTAMGPARAAQRSERPQMATAARLLRPRLGGQSVTDFHQQVAEESPKRRAESHLASASDTMARLVAMAGPSQTPSALQQATAAVVATAISLAAAELEVETTSEASLVSPFTSLSSSDAWNAGPNTGQTENVTSHETKSKPKRASGAIADGPPQHDERQPSVTSGNQDFGVPLAEPKRRRLSRAGTSKMQTDVLPVT
eukprot:TRINITY_DN23932_c0_g1_i1.p1 TRINITY_DN23932_c0_g1~~TRINITY_DN23932_c0_g1_i1.p1  ORF type:complete len:1076 (+),score=237.34 TRINITY_DN23932_c0_g1_i1:548-3775(+)